MRDRRVGGYFKEKLIIFSDSRTMLKCINIKKNKTEANKENQDARKKNYRRKLFGK